MHPAVVEHDAAEPAGEAVGGGERAQVQIGCQRRLLKYVRNFLAIFDDPSCQASPGAPVALKERRRLALLVRESPLHTGHLRTMTAASELGAVIVPPVPAFYANPRSLEDIIDHTIGRVLDLFDIDAGLVRRWGEPAAEGAEPVGPSRRQK